ncbi:MAG: hypothetical protein Q8S19_09795 [Bacillota bacterium]|nr:hypothetical protein [Bacillota bacterium]
MMRSDGTTIKTVYNNNHLQTRVETEGLGLKQQIVTTYDSHGRKTPAQVATTSYNSTGASATSTIYTTFDQYNNLTNSKDALGTETFYTYDASKRHQLTSIQTTRTGGAIMRTE